MDNVLPVVQVFSAPYFLLSSDNLAPVEEIKFNMLALMQFKAPMTMRRKRFKKYLFQVAWIQSQYNLPHHEQYLFGSAGKAESQNIEFKKE